MVDEGFDAIVGMLSLAKGLHEIGRYDIVKEQFSDSLCYDGYYDSIMTVISSIFPDYEGRYDDDEYEYMEFCGDVIKDYFVYAWKYGKQNNIPYNKNPYATQAQDAISNLLSFSYCLDWKLLAYTKTEKAARKSKLLVNHYVMCGCTTIETFAFRLIKVYSWFANKCAEFKVQEANLMEVIIK